MISEMTLETLQQQRHDRKKKIARAWKAYEGSLKQPLKPITSDPEGRDNVIINLASVVVEVTISSLLGEEVKITAADEADNEWLQEWMEANDWPVNLHALAANGAVAGQAFARIEPAPEFPRLTILDSATVDMLGERDDYSDIFAYIIEWRGVDLRIGKPYARRQVHQRGENRRSWTITDFIQYGDGNPTLLFGAMVRSPKWEQIGEAIHPYPWSQIHTCQNLPLPNVAWGQPDLDDDVLNLMDAISANRSYVQRITRMYAHPRAVAKGFTADKLRVDADATLHIPQDGELQYLEMRNNLEGITEHYLRLLEALCEVTRTPGVAIGRTENLGALSGIALQILYGPLRQKTQTKRMLYGKLLRDLVAHALEMGRGTTADVQIKWPDVHVTNEVETYDTAIKKLEAGVSRATVLAELGYNPEAEREQRLAEKQEDQTVGEVLLQAFERGITDTTNA